MATAARGYSVLNSAFHASKNKSISFVLKVLFEVRLDEKEKSKECLSETSSLLLHHNLELFVRFEMSKTRSIFF